MARELSDELMRRIKEEQDALLEGARPPVNKKKFREEQRRQREADLASCYPDDGFYERFMERLRSMTRDLDKYRR